MPSHKAMSISAPGEEPADPDYWIHLLRQKDYEQFEMVVVSHLTKLIDFPDEQLSRLFGEFQESSRKAASATPQDPPIPLNEDLKIIMSKLFQHVKAQVDDKAVGVFRQSGNNNRCSKLMDLLQRSPSVVDLETNSEFNVHDSVTVIKRYLKRIPEPLLMPSRYLEAHTKIANLPPDQAMKRMECIQLLLLLLPHHYRELLHGLFHLLQYTYQQSKTWENAGDLAKAIAPSLILPRNDEPNSYIHVTKALNDHVGFMILNTNAIFSSPKHIQEKVKRYWQESNSSRTGLEQLAAPSSAVKRSRSNVQRDAKMTEKFVSELQNSNSISPKTKRELRKRGRTLEKYSEDDARREKLPRNHGLKCFTPGS